VIWVQGYLSEIFVSFQGEGAHVGERHLFVRMAGCNIRCVYCDTPNSLERMPGFTVFGPGNRDEYRPNPIDAGELRALIESILDDQGPIDALALTGGEPLVQASFLAEVLGGRRIGAPVLLETNGMLPQRLKEILPLIDIISMDIKLPSNSGERPFWEEHGAFVEVARGKEIYAKILVDRATSEDDIRQAADVLEKGRSGLPTFLQPITDASGLSKIDSSQLDQLFIALRRRHPNVRVLPQTHKMMGLR